MVNFRNMNARIDGNRVISYTTHVATIDHANRTVIRLGWWSKTTSRHINHAARELGYKVVDPLASTRKEAAEREEKAAAGLLRMAGAFAALADLTSNNKKEANTVKARVFAAAGCTLPGDWDQLPEDVKAERLAKVQSIALEHPTPDQYPDETHPHK